LPLGARQLLGTSGEPSRTDSIAGRDALFAAIMAEGPASQSFDLPGTKDNSPIFAGQPEREPDGPVSDMPQLSRPAPDGLADQGSVAAASASWGDGIADCIAADWTSAGYE